MHLALREMNTIQWVYTNINGVRDQGTTALIPASDPVALTGSDDLAVITTLARRFNPSNDQQKGEPWSKVNQPFPPRVE
jgi:hypothetical protein